MKMSKRIFVVLLTVAILVCGFAFSASADEVTLENYENLLDYYEKPIIFDLDFSHDEVEYTDNWLVSDASKLTHSVVEDAAAPGGKYLKIQVPNTRPMGAHNVYFNWNDSGAGTDEFYLDMTFSGAKSGTAAPKYRLIVSDEVLTEASAGRTSGYSLLTLNFNDGKVSYSALVDGAAQEVVLDYTLTQDAWYDLSLTYVAGDACVVTLTNVNNAEDTVSLSDVYLPYELIKNVRFGVHGTDIQYSNGNTIKIASLEAACGAARRNLYDRQGAVEAGIIDLYEIYCSDSVSIEDKIGLCTVTNRLVVNYGFTSDNEEVNNAIAELRYGSVTLYSDELAEFVEKLSATDNYYDRKALVEEYKEFAETLAGMDISIVGDEEAAVIESNIDALYSEEERLVRAESDSLAFIAALEGVESVLGSKDYAELKAYYDVASIYNPDVTYEGVSEVYGYYEIISDKILDIKEEGDYFIAMVNRANDENLSFVQRYDTYTKIEQITNVNQTYPGVSEAVELYNDSVKPYISYEVGLVENFILYVNRADYSIYVSAKQENLNLASEYMDICEPTFPGVAEAKVLYGEIQQYINEQIAHANAYISAVNATDGLSGEALLTAIAKAQNLQESGNVLGVDGVIEANIKLNQLVSSIELKDKYCIHFISIVNSLDGVKDTQERYDILLAAKAAEGDADASYAGVSDASAKLNKAIEDFNAQINKVNEIFVTANTAAANTTGAGKTANTVADYVIAIIKKFFDDEE